MSRERAAGLYSSPFHLGFWATAQAYCHLTLVEVDEQDDLFQADWQLDSPFTVAHAPWLQADRQYPSLLAPRHHVQSPFSERATAHSGMRAMGDLGG
jgi:hypothetical protein